VRAVESSSRRRKRRARRNPGINIIRPYRPRENASRAASVNKALRDARGSAPFRSHQLSDSGRVIDTHGERPRISYRIPRRPLRRFAKSPTRRYLIIAFIARPSRALLFLSENGEGNRDAGRPTNGEWMLGCAEKLISPVLSSFNCFIVVAKRYSWTKLVHEFRDSR
jgi:hypothetical protein